MSISPGLIIAGAAAYEVGTWTASTVAAGVVSKHLPNLKNQGDVSKMMKMDDFKKALKAKKEAVVKAEETKQEVAKETAGVLPTAKGLFASAVKAVTPVSQKGLEQTNEILLDLLAEHEILIERLETRLEVLEKKAKVKPVALTKEQLEVEALDRVRDEMYQRWLERNGFTKKEEPKEEAPTPAEEEDAAKLKKLLEDTQKQLAELKKQEVEPVKEEPVEPNAGELKALIEKAKGTPKRKTVPSNEPVEEPKEEAPASGPRMRVNFTKVVK